MEVTAALTERIKERIREFTLDPSPDPQGLRETVVRLNALPILFDMGGCFAVRPNGEVVSFAWDERDDVRVEDDLRIRNLALFQGSKKYPELEDLIEKPSDATECPDCKGTGREPTAVKLGLDNLVCYCGGLGWLP